MDKTTASTCVATIGIDLGKRVFQIHGIDTLGEIVTRRSVKRRELPPAYVKGYVRRQKNDMAQQGFRGQSGIVPMRSRASAARPSPIVVPSRWPALPGASGATAPGA